MRQARTPKQQSAGLLLYRKRGAPEVLLGHPGGPFWAKKDEAAWTIPKGLIGPRGDAARGSAARIRGKIGRAHV